MVYSDAIEFLYSLQVFGVKLGLENTRRLAALAGNPQERLRLVHVAGTNGKGSTCAMLESIYRAAGLRTGLYTSPHLVSFRERIQVNRKWISQEAVVRLVAELRRLDPFTEGAGPTFFEFVTVMALRYFVEEHCDLVIWETGMGGRLDATNIVTPLASVITNIDFDHQAWLGNTLAEIAAEKAGIIKPGVPLITAEQKPEPLEVINRKAASVQAPVRHVAAAELPGWLDQLGGLAGPHQRVNASLALTTVRALAEEIPVSEDALRAGLADVQWPGRFQRVALGEGRTVILDGAHNPSGAETLRITLANEYPNTRFCLVFGAMRDKNWQAICQELVPHSANVLLVPVASERTADPELVRVFAAGLNPEAPVRICSSLQEALTTAKEEALVVVTGSLYLIGEALEVLGLVERDVSSERGLNHWRAAGR